MSDTAEIIRKLQEPFPREAIKTRSGGGNTRLSYVEAHSVIRRLNAATGGQWDFAVLREEREGDLLKATCRLTIPGLGSREHVGVQKVSERGGEDLHKGAISDALKKAATLFGVGLELYGPDYEDDDGHAASQPRRAESAPQPIPARSQAARPAPPAAAPRPIQALTLDKLAELLEPLARQVRLNDEALSPDEYTRYHELDAAYKARYADLLAIMRDDEADPKRRKAALHEYYGGTRTIAGLGRYKAVAEKSGLPADDLAAAYSHHHNRLAQLLAPVERPASYAG